MSVKYKSTRGKQTGLTFEEVVLGGLAKDKGLFIPETIPHFTLQQIEKMRKMSYPQVAFEVISSFVGEEDIPADNLRDIIVRSFAAFRTPDVAPSVKLSEFWILELFHGPTFAFKDVALQFLGNVFEFFLTRGEIQSKITILGATSGDTGSAAIHGLRGKQNVDCFIMFPNGKVTEIQERQMTTIADDNVHCLSIEGDFDDAQAIVKSAFADSTFRSEVQLGAVNSINWARVLAQITYYFYSWLRVTDGITDGGVIPAINYAVPTGNFGDILAGFYAKKMGLSIDKLIICTNENDVLNRFMETGVYKKNPAVLTIAPSMDISISSNFERYLYYLSGESSEKLANWMSIFEATGEISVSKDILKTAKLDFLSYTANKPSILKAMKTLQDTEKYLVCPHTATAVVAVQSLGLNTHKTVCLATAHPAKFEEALKLSIGKIPTRPVPLEILFKLPTKKIQIPNSLKKVQDYIRGSLGMPVKKKEGTSDLVTTSITVLSTAVVVTLGFILIRNMLVKK